MLLAVLALAGWLAAGRCGVLHIKLLPVVCTSPQTGDFAKPFNATFLMLFERDELFDDVSLCGDCSRGCTCTVEDIDDLFFQSNDFGVHIATTNCAGTGMVSRCVKFHETSTRNVHYITIDYKLGPGPDDDVVLSDSQYIHSYGACGDDHEIIVTPVH